MAAPPRDALDDLADELHGDWERLSAAPRAALLEAVKGATTLEEFTAALKAHVMTAPIEELHSALTIARTKARVAGEGGAEL